MHISLPHICESIVDLKCPELERFEEEVWICEGERIGERELELTNNVRGGAAR